MLREKSYSVVIDGCYKSRIDIGATDDTKHSFGVDGAVFTAQRTECGVLLTGTTHHHSCAFSDNDTKTALAEISSRIQDIEHFNYLIEDALRLGENSSMRVLRRETDRLMDSLADYILIGFYTKRVPSTTTTTTRYGPVIGGELYSSSNTTITVVDTSVAGDTQLHNLPVPAAAPQYTCTQCSSEHDLFHELPESLKETLVTVCPTLRDWWSL